MKANPCRKRRLFLIANKLVSVITLIFFSAGTVFALPAGQQVVNGQAAFNTQGNNLTITNSPNAIINWQGFSIHNNEAVRFIQQYGSSAVLNRVIGQDPSRILGLLQSNGRVFLINPNGILFGQGARIDVNGLIASTLNISNQDFLAGKYNFTAGSIAGSIQNQGTITTPEGGKVYLIAPDIENSGIITTPKGDVLLAAGHSVQLVDSLDPDIAVVVSAPENKAVNLGQIVAQSGKVGIYGGLISQRGIVNADSAVVGENGRIFFKASKDVTLDAGSTTSARGGTIKVLGDMESGTVRVSGTLDASAPNGGDGGFIETSAAHVKVDDSARITTLAPYGKAGFWLIDPTDYTIAAADPQNGSSYMSNTTLSTNLGLGAIVIQTLGTGVGNGDIFVDDAVSWSSNYGLTLSAYRNININANITATGGGGIEIHAAGDVTQNAGSIANTIAGSTAPGSYDINISGHDVNLRSVASQRDIDVTAQSLTVGNIQALGSQGFHVDDQYFTYLLPFSFSFYDTPYSTAYISSNGIITFGSGTSAYTDSTSYLPYYKIIASAWNDWDTRDNLNFTRPLDVYVSSTSGALAVRWDVARYPVTSQSAQFETVLYNNGNIKFNYGPANTSFAGDVTIGLSNQSSASTLVSQLMSQPNFSMNNLRSTTFSYASGQYSETLSSGSDWNATMPGAGTGGITSLGNITLNSASSIAINGIVNAGNNLKLAGAGIVSQMAPITAAGLELLGAEATYNLTHTGNAITTLAGNTGTVNFTNSTGIGIGTVNTAGLATSGDLTLNSGGAITQSAPLQVVGVATFDAGAGNDITLTNPGNNFGSIGITSGNNVSLTDTDSLALNTSTVSNSLSATAGGDITLNGLVTAGTGEGTGSVTLKSSGGAIINGMESARSISAGSLVAEAVNGIGSGAALITGVNQVTALNTIANNIEIDNTGVLAVSGLSNGGTGDVILENTGAITTDTSTVTSSGGSVSITAHSPLTIGAGGVSAYSSISLEASPSGGSDNLTINGNIASSNGNIILSAGSGIVIGPGIVLSAPNGTITLNGTATTGTGNLAVTGNATATDNTVSSLMTAMANITSVERDDENELTTETREGGERTTDDKKTDASVKNYCN